MPSPGHRRSPTKSSGRAVRVVNEEETGDPDTAKKSKIMVFKSMMSSTKLFVLVLLCMQNTLFTVLRRYSQGVLKEIYSKYEVLLVGEIIKFVYSAYKITSDLGPGEKPVPKLRYLLKRSSKMAVLAGIYGAMNILSFVSLRNISAGMFTVFAQLKILTTATCSSVMLRRSYSMTKWRALISLMMGVLLFSEPIWNKADNSKNPEGGNVILGTAAVLIEVTLSGFASIYFEKVIKTDPEQLGIWERNYQLAFGSIPIYIMFMLWEDGGVAGYFGGWSVVAGILALLGAAGGMLVALSIKHGDSILKTLATTGAIVLSATLDHYILGGPLTNIMCIAGVIVVLSICNYTFDASPPEKPLQVEAKSEKADEEIALTRGTAAR
jgi:UDP-sugar transporter A1/2/3